MKIKNRHLEELWSALSDLGANRLPYKLAARTHNMKRMVQDVLEHRDNLKKALTQPYMPDGRLVESVMTDGELKRLLGFDGYNEALKKVEELWEDEVELELGAPVDLSTLDEKALETLVLMEASQGTLQKYGLIVEP